jgi:hypothetical protein
VNHDDERGAVAVIIAICAIVLFGAAAFAIDTGNAWQTRRNMVTATDASALGAAGKFAVGQDGCGAGGAPDFLAANRSDATLDVCSPSTTNTRDGYVTVKGHTTVDFAFGGIFGISNRNVSSTTTARWGVASGAVNLRPIGLCITATPQLEQWLNLPTGPTGPTTTPITIMLNNSQPDSCKDDSGNVAGNWGLVFGSGNNSNSDTVDWLNNGYPTEVSVGDNIHANPGAFSGSMQSALQGLESNGTWFALPVFDHVVGNGGNNAQYHVVSFVWVQLVDYRVSGAQSQRYITLNMDRGVISGSCCGPALDTGTRVVYICDVDTLAPNTTDPRAC